MLVQYDDLRSKYPTVLGYAVGALWARQRLAEVLWATEQRTEAVELLRQAAALSEQFEWDDPAAQDYCAWFLVFSPDQTLRNPGRAIELARSAVEHSPRTGDYWMTLGIAQYRAGQYDAAIKSLEQAVQLPFRFHSSPAHFFLAMAHWQLGRRDRAAAEYRQGVDQLENRDYVFLEFQRTRTEAEKLIGIGETNSAPARSDDPVELRSNSP